MERRDLSHDLASGEPYPGDPVASVEPVATMAEDGYRVAEIACSTHSGTHVDAPSHLVASGRSLGEFDVSEFHFEALLVDCTDFGPREPIPADRVPRPHDGSQTTDSADLVVFQTGWSDHWGTATYFDHPYLMAEAAERCAENGYTVGIDAPSVDPTPTADLAGTAADNEPADNEPADNEPADNEPAVDEPTGSEPSGYPAHEVLLGTGNVIVENLTGLAGLPERFTLHTFPLPVDADGAPVRAVAEL